MGRWLFLALASALLGLALRRLGVFAPGGAVDLALASPLAVPVLASLTVVALAIAISARRRADRAEAEAGRLAALFEAGGRPVIAPPPLSPELPAPRPHAKQPQAEQKVTATPAGLLVQPVVALSSRRVVAYVAAPFDPIDDRGVLAAAAEAIALRPDTLGRAPLFVPVGDRLLSDPVLPSLIAGLVRGRPAVARSLALLAPANALAGAPPGLAALGLPAIAADKPFADGDWAALRLRGVSHFRLKVADLLDASPGRRLRQREAIEQARAAGLAVLADGVADEGEPARLIDLGVDLVSGPLFAAPMRLKAIETDGAEASRLNRR